MTKGRYSQRMLVPIMCGLIDAASAKGASAHRDIARTELRRVLKEEHWNTSYVLNNVGRARSRYIAGLGHPIPYRWIESGWKVKKTGDEVDPWEGVTSD